MSDRSTTGPGQRPYGRTMSAASAATNLTGRLSLRPTAIELVVADMAASLAFYRLIGLDIPAEADQEPHVQVPLGGGVELALDTVETIRTFEPDWTPNSGGHRMGLVFQCDSPADLDAAYAAILAAGHQGHLEPWDAFWGMRWAVVLDPDGAHIALGAFLPS